MRVSFSRMSLRSSGLRPKGEWLHVDAGGERVLLDESASRLDLVAHELVEQHVGLIDLFHAHLQQRPRIGIERRLPELIWVHLAEAFIALERYALAPGSGHGLEQSHRPMDSRLVLLARERRRAWIDLLQRGRMLVELARVGGCE